MCAGHFSVSLSTNELNLTLDASSLGGARRDRMSMDETFEGEAERTSEVMKLPFIDYSQ